MLELYRDRCQESGDSALTSNLVKSEARSDVAILAAVPLPETLEQAESPSTLSAKTLPRACGPRKDGNGVSWEFMKRGADWSAFVLLPCLFLLSGWRTEPWPVLREGAIQGEVGPWGFTLAETESTAPKVGGSGVTMKEFELRFADDALPEIRTAYLRARKPRSLRTAGIAFEGNHLRTASILIPPAFQAEEPLWFTMEGRNGEVHHAAADVRQLFPRSPASSPAKKRHRRAAKAGHGIDLPKRGSRKGCGRLFLV
jgi:hypothetical protein